MRSTWLGLAPSNSGAASLRVSSRPSPTPLPRVTGPVSRMSDECASCGVVCRLPCPPSHFKNNLFVCTCSTNNPLIKIKA